MSYNGVEVYCGEGKGKSNAAIGLCLKYASQGKTVIIVQFLKGSNRDELSILERLEPEIRLFRFEKKDCPYSELSREEQQEQDTNIRNGLNYVKKVLVTGECDLLVVDELLGLLDNHIIEMEDVIRLMESKSDDTMLILTGRNLPVKLTAYVDDVFEIKTVKKTEH